MAAMMGLLLRLAHVYPVNFNYTYIIHAHSHTAMLGWAYMMIYSLIIHYFIPREKVLGSYNKLFWITQISVIGMMVTFPFQGYALYSIIFSTSHILCSYYFCYKIWKDIDTSNLPAVAMLKTALVFMMVSTLGAWSLGVIAGCGAKDTALYYTAIQFFLHFQFNGWFIFAILALFFMVFKASFAYNLQQFKLFHYLLTASVILTLALPVGWYYPGTALLILNSLGTLLQAMALLLFLRLILPGLPAVINKVGSSGKWLLALSIISFSIKMMMQLTTSFPAMAQASHSIRSFTVGFIHLAMLGVITGFLFAFLQVSGFIGNSRLWRYGLMLLFSGFIFTELMLFVAGILTFASIGQITGYSTIMFLVSILLPLGLSFIIIGVLRAQKNNPAPIQHYD
jgi:hypothetical protein